MSQIPYRSEIDGLRALAVLAVVFDHAGFAGVSGGFLGVDVFFVISGYLITTICFAETAEGRFSIVQFYLRRARRILPALFTVLAITLVLGYLWLPTRMLYELGQFTVATSIFGANLKLAQGTDYFGASAALNPLIHMWSLSVEEQFYIVFPGLLLIGMAAGRRALAYILAMFFVSSLLYADYLTQLDPVSSYYLPLTRFWEILAGVLLAFVGTARLRSTPAGFQQTTSMLGLAGLILCFTTLSPAVRHPGITTLAPVICTMLLIGFGSGTTLAARILSLPPLTAIGLISYSLYLWHQPVLAFARLRIGEEGLGPLDYGSLILGSIVLAAISYVLIERPCRNPRRNPARVFIPLCVVVAVSLIGVSRVTTLGARPGHELALRPQAIQDASKLLDPNYGLGKLCDVSASGTPTCATGSVPDIVVWGDSHAMHLINAIRASEPDIQLAQMTTSGCTPLIPGGEALLMAAGEEQIASCREFNIRVTEWLDRTARAGTYVVLASNLRKFSSTKNAEHSQEAVPAPESASAVQEALMSTALWLREKGYRPVLVTSPPTVGGDPGLCQFRRLALKARTECSFDRNEARAFDRSTNDLISGLEDKLPVIHLENALCISDRCITTLEGTPLYRDQDHLSIDGATQLGRVWNFTAAIRNAAAQD